jgi:hypothetical protein
MLGPPKRRLALAPVAKTGAPAAQDMTCVQSENLSAPTATSADELEEDTT